MTKEEHKKSEKIKLHPFEEFILNEVKDKLMEIYETTKPVRFNAEELYRPLNLPVDELFYRQEQLDVITVINLQARRRRAVEELVKSYYPILEAKMQKVNRHLRVRQPYTAGLEFLKSLISGAL